jgi:hypothetical protein
MQLAVHVADHFHYGIQDGLDFDETLGDGSAARRQVHAQEVELQTGGTQILSDAIVQELREAGAIGFQGFERAQDDTGFGHLVRDAAGEGDFTFGRSNRKKSDGKSRARIAEPGGGAQRLAQENAIAAADPGKARGRRKEIGEIQTLEFRGRTAKYAGRVSIDRMECAVMPQQPGATGALAKQ